MRNTKGDGTTDDSSAIQDAIDVANAADGGADIPSGKTEGQQEVQFAGS